MTTTAINLARADRLPVNLKDLGVKGDGTNETAAIQAALNTSATSFAVPGGVYGISATITLPVGKSLRIAPDATFKALSAIAGPMLDTPVGTRTDNQSVIGGTFDCNNLAQTGVYLRNFAHFTLSDVLVKNPTSHGVILHDTAAPSVSYEAIVDRVGTLRDPTGAVPAGSIGLWVRSTDSFVTRVVPVGQDIGIRVDTEQNVFIQCHPWGFNGHLPTTCFYDNSYGNQWIGCDADTPAQYGWYCTGKYTNFVGCRVFNNGYGIDNAVTGIYLADSAPTASVSGFRLVGYDASHRIAKDFDGPSPSSGSVIFGVNAQNVVSRTIPFTNQIDLLRMTSALTIHSLSATRALAVRDGTGTHTYMAVDPNSAQRRLLIGNGAFVSGYSDELTTETVRLNPATGAVVPGSTAGLGVSLYSGAGAPAIAGAVGDIYLRSDATPSTALYRCTTAGAAGSAVWTRLSSAAYDFPYTVDPGMIRSSDATPVGGVNNAVYMRVQGAGNIDRIGVFPAVSSGSISVAAYRNSGTGRAAAPGTLLATSGAIACPAANTLTLVALGSAVDVNPGDWIAISADNTTATFRSLLATPADSALGAGRQYRQASAHPLPTTPSSLVATVGYTIALVGDHS